MKKHLLYAILFLSPVFSFGYSAEYLRVGDVRNSWSTYPATIDSSTIYIEPKGLYAEIQLFLDFSVKCTSFNGAQDSLEIQMGFNLPANAEVTDMWLWVGNLPVRARMCDRWTAAQIYNGIVKRRQDPALLIKESDTFYTLNIFPMNITLPRKIKITYQVPISRLTGASQLIPLPLNILKLSNCQISKIKVVYKPAFDLGNPVLQELPSAAFSQVVSNEFGQHYAANIASISSVSSLMLSVNKSVQTDYFASVYPIPSTTQGIYQMELNIQHLLNLPSQRKTLFLIDFVKSKSTLSRQEVLQTLKSYIRSGFEQGDSLNFMFTGFYTNAASSQWISADSASLTSLFNSLDTTDFSDFTNLPVLMADGIDFIRTHGNNGTMALISSSANYGNTSQANAFLVEIMTAMGSKKIPIHTLSLDNITYPSYNYNGGNPTVNKGNDYFLSCLSALTAGEFQAIQVYKVDNSYYYSYQEEVYSYPFLLGEMMPRLSGSFIALDVYTTMQSGFTFANYHFNSANGIYYYSTPFRQVGKYTGSAPMQIMITAQTPDGNIHNTQLTLNAGQVYNADSLSTNIWAAQKLREMMGYTQTSTVIYQIMQTSITERVLSKYTALLALEPSQTPVDTIDADGDGDNGGVTIGIEEPSANQGFSISCYPNPVKDAVTFTFDLEESGEVVIEIYNMEGQKMAIVVNKKMLSGKHEVAFDATQLPAGVYFYRSTIDGKHVSTGKMVVMK